jgi:hypothetical protein
VTSEQGWLTTMTMTTKMMMNVGYSVSEDLIWNPHSPHLLSTAPQVAAVENIASIAADRSTPHV